MSSDKDGNTGMTKDLLFKECELWYTIYWKEYEKAKGLIATYETTHILN